MNYEYIKLDIMCYCCVCLNTLTDEFITSICCNQMLHKKCLMNWICSSSNVSITCPICRRDIVLDNIIKLEDFVIYINQDLEKDKYINETKIKEILSKLYKDDYFIKIMIENSETTKENCLRKKFILNYILKMIVFFCLLICVLFMITNI